MSSKKGFYIVGILAVCFAIAFLEFGMDNVFVVKDDGLVPVFVTDKLDLQYESGKGGTNCYELDTVLLPNTRIKVAEKREGGVSKIEYYLSKACNGTGYVHNDFLKKSCGKLHVLSEKNLSERAVEPAPMPLSRIRKLFEYCINNGVPYCFGGNNFERIELPKEYSFSPFGEQVEGGRPYELRGLDCSGLPYLISNGTLPHCTRGLDKMGDEVFTFDWQKEYSLEEKERVLGLLRDTDYLVFLHNRNLAKTVGSGHVIVSFNGGFIEFKNKNCGCVYTDKEHAMERLNSMLNASRNSCSNLFIRRWHPEVIHQ